MFIFSNVAFAIVPVKNAYTNVAVNVCQPNDTGTGCTGVAGGSQWVTTNVGIGTYGNVGIGTTVPSANLDIVSGTQTTSVPAINVTQTWNGAGVVFDAVKVNVSKSASSALSGLIDAQIGGNTFFRVGEGASGYGSLWLGAGITPSTANITMFVTGGTVYYNSAQSNGNFGWYLGNSQGVMQVTGSGTKLGTFIPSTYEFGWSATTDAVSGTPDTSFSRMAAGSIGVGNAVIGNNGGTLSAGNIGIGTFDVSGGGLIVKTGNVGMGTTTPVGGLAVMNGNVGIGTWVPSSGLDLRAVGLTIFAKTDTDFSLTNPGLYIRSGTTGGGTGPALRVDTPNGTRGMVATSSALAFGSNSLDASISYANGDITVGGGGNQQLLNLASGYGSVDKTATTIDLSAIFNNNLRLFTTNIANSVVLQQSGGNVGIGTGVPASVLSVAGGVGIGTGVNSTYVSTAAPVGGMIVQGNVGIGSTAPGTALDVNGTIRTAAGTVGIPAYSFIGRPNQGIWDNGGQIELSIAGVDAFSFQAGGTMWSKSDTAGGGLYFGSSAAVSLTRPSAGNLSIAGNLGIGTVIPSATLEVKGTMTVRGAQTSPWTVKTGTNTACNTTCGTSMCAFGEDTIGLVMLACTDATADTCLCMGP